MRHRWVATSLIVLGGCSGGSTAPLEAHQSAGGPSAPLDAAGPGIGQPRGDVGAEVTGTPRAVSGCEPGSRKCSPLGRRVLDCKPDGTGFAAGAFCSAEAPICLNGSCRADLQCAPGSTRCAGLSAVEICRPDASGHDLFETCPEGSICKGAECVSACEADLKENTYLGCEYWAVDLDNVEGGAGQAVAVVVSNPSPAQSAVVRITSFATGEELPSDGEVGPLSQRTFLLPPGFDLDGSGLSRRSFRVRASSPITVHQFNPINATGVFSNDASLLLPGSSGGREFLVMGWPQRQADTSTGFVPVRGFVTIVAVAAAPTTVTVVPSTLVEPGEGVGQLAPGVEPVFELEYGDDLNLETGGGASGPDLTGTRISASRRVAVLAGHECANIPLRIEADQFVGADYCDHIEQQLFPVETWGREYIADAFSPRSPSQRDVWRIMAGADGVVVDTQPPQVGAIQATLGAGQYVELQTGATFRVTATGPIAVGHYLQGSKYEGFAADPACAQGSATTGVGDPAFTLALPLERLLDRTIVLTPPGYRQGWLIVIHRVGSAVSVDGVPLALTGLPIGGSDWAVERVAVPPGVHTVEGDQPVGITAYGYDCDVSYAYPGGLQLEPGKEGME